jgi:chromosome segregation ATPase
MTMATNARKKPALSGEAKAAYGELQKGVNHLKKSIADARRDLRKAEQKIEADARARVRDLRKEARAQLTTLEARRREASRTLKTLSAAAGDSWQEIKHSADSILADARAIATSVIERFRSALGG